MSAKQKKRRANVKSALANIWHPNESKTKKNKINDLHNPNIKKKQNTI